jgi:hypothetical protein
MFDLKRLTKNAIPRALEKAERYRLLNEPGEAESICLDILAIDPENQPALLTLLLALTEQFDERLSESLHEAREVLPHLADEYGRAYYAGIICERRAKALLRLGGPASGYVAYDGLQEAMEWYAKAEALRPAGNDDALLRWNTCARLIERNPRLVPGPADGSEPPLE